MLIDCVGTGLTGELFHTAAGAAFADVAVNGRRETWPIHSNRFRALLRRCHYEATSTALDGAAIRSTLDLLEARALFDAPQRAVHVRIAEHSGRIYLDLADEHWRAVEIGPDGWQVIESPPVRFRRPAGMLPIPAPERGGSVEALASFLNPVKPKRFCGGSGLAVGSFAVRRPLSIAGDIRRAGVSKNRPFEAAQVLGRSQCSTGASTRPRGTRADDRGEQWSSPCL
jgi:hypothetical protein